MRIYKCYLLTYNTLLTFGWLGVLVMLYLEMTGAAGYKTVYAKVETLLKVCQTAAVLEVVHCVLGLVPSSVVLTACQVWSRIFVLWFVTHLVVEVQNQFGVVMFIVCWSVTEVIRYSYYASSILENVPYALLWCRYTFFIFLYPIGVTGELMTIYAALPIIQKSMLLSLQMPNVLNFAFSYYYYLLFTMLLYIPVFPQLYLHMVSQRRKFITGLKAKTQ